MIGAASVRAMKPSLAPLTSGPGPAAKAPLGKASCTAAKRAVVPAALSSPRLLTWIFSSVLVTSISPEVWRSAQALRFETKIWSRVRRCGELKEQ
jgi:hypothetical protein